MFAHPFSRQMGLALVALAWLCLGSFAATAQPAEDYRGDDPHSSFSELDRYGHWVEHAEWGTVWAPDVDDDWRPYTLSRWVFTDEHGWYWDSDEPFGWAVYHYGRWLEDPNEGWIWVPGTQWGPAWVAWRYGDDAVGWAPLPPDAVWQPDSGLELSDEIYHGARYAPFWIFVAPRYLMSPSLHRFVAPTGRNAAFFARTRPSTRYDWAGRNIFNHGVDRHEVERLTQSRVPRLALMPSARPTMGRRAGAGAVFAYRPAIVPSSRWQAGRSGNWRQFEPAARPPRAAPFGNDRAFNPRRERDAGPQQPSRVDRNISGGDVQRDGDFRRRGDTRPDDARPDRLGRDGDLRRDNVRRDGARRENDGDRLQRPYQERSMTGRTAPERPALERPTPERPFLDRSAPDRRSFEGPPRRNYDRPVSPPPKFSGRSPHNKSGPSVSGSREPREDACRVRKLHKSRGPTAKRPHRNSARRRHKPHPAKIRSSNPSASPRTRHPPDRDKVAAADRLAIGGGAAYHAEYARTKCQASSRRSRVPRRT